MRFFLGIYKINRSLHLSTRLLKVYTEASWGAVTHKPSRWSQQHIALLSLCPSKSFPCWEQWTECAFQGQGRRHGASNCRGPAHGATGRHILSMTSSNKWVLSVCFRWWKCFGTTEYLLLHNTVYVLNAHLKVVQFSSVAQSCLTLCDPMDCSTPGLPIPDQLPEFTQTHVHQVGDAIQPSHPLSSPSPPTFNLSQHQSLFKWVSSLHQMAKVS